MLLEASKKINIADMRFADIVVLKMHIALLQYTQ